MTSQRQDKAISERAWRRHIYRPWLSLPVSIGISLVCVLVDQLTKAWVVDRLGTRDLAGRRLIVWKDHVELIYAHDMGGAWGILGSQPESVLRPFYLLVASVVIALIIALIRRVRLERGLLRFGLLIMWSGSLGNLTDRLRHGHVIDFIDVQISGTHRPYHWPTFNLADVAFVVGVVALWAGALMRPQLSPHTPLGWSFRSRSAVVGLLITASTFPLFLVLGMIALIPAMLLTAMFETVLPKPVGTIVGWVLQLSVQVVAVLVVARVWQKGRILGQPTARELLQIDRRPPVLLLRSFYRDRYPIERPAGFLRVVFSGLFIDEWTSQTFEDALTKILSRIGPPITLGRPGELEAPLGAAREYAGEDRWRGQVLQWASAASMVAIIPDDTPSLRWEISEVRRLGKDILMVLPPCAPVENEASAWAAGWARLREAFTELPPIDMKIVALLWASDGHISTFHSPSQRTWDQLAAIEKALMA